MIDIHFRTFERLQTCEDIPSGQGDLIILVTITLDHMKLDSSVNGVIMIVIMGVSSSNGILKS